MDFYFIFILRSTSVIELQWNTKIKTSKNTDFNREIFIINVYLLINRNFYKWKEYHSSGWVSNWFNHPVANWCDEAMNKRKNILLSNIDFIFSFHIEKNFASNSLHHNSSFSLFYFVKNISLILWEKRILVRHMPCNPALSESDICTTII